MEERIREHGTLMQMFARDIGKVKPLSKEEEEALILRLRSGDAKAMNRLIEANLRFVVWAVFRYWKPGYPVMDMLSEGCLGLVKAARRFDPARPVRFISYAALAVRHGIIRAIIDSMRHAHESLDSPVFDEEGETLMDNLASDGNNPEEEAEAHDVGRSLSLLNKRERFIIEERHWKEKTLDEVGKSLGIKRERVRQIEARALLKLRCALREKKK